MKKNIVKHFVAVFFIALYLLKGVAALMPALLTDPGNKSFLTELLESETENNKTSEEKADTETKELYLHHNYLIHLSLPATNAIAKNIAENKIAFKQHVYASIPTPPPELI